MVNYKRHSFLPTINYVVETSSIGYGTTGKDASIKTIFDYNLSTAKSLGQDHDTAYSPPAGFHFDIKYIQITHSATTGNVKFFEGATEDATTTEILRIPCPAVIGTTTFPVNLNTPIASAKFLTCTAVAASLFILVIGMESEN